MSWEKLGRWLVSTEVQIDDDDDDDDDDDEDDAAADDDDPCHIC